MNKIITLGEPQPGNSSPFDPNEFRDLRTRFEKRLAELLGEYTKTIADSPVGAADADTALTTFDQRWQTECDLADRKNFPAKRDAFRKAIAELDAKAARKALFNGPITPEALELVGFRKWDDNTWRTQEVMVQRVGEDWQVTICQALIGKHSMPYLLQVINAVGIKHLTPFNQPARLPMWRRLLAR